MEIYRVLRRVVLMDLPDAEIELKKAYQVLGAHLKQPSEPIISINMPRCSLDSKPI